MKNVIENKIEQISQSSSDFYKSYKEMVEHIEALRATIENQMKPLTDITDARGIDDIPMLNTEENRRRQQVGGRKHGVDNVDKASMPRSFYQSNSKAGAIGVYPTTVDIDPDAVNARMYAQRKTQKQISDLEDRNAALRDRNEGNEQRLEAALKRIKVLEGKEDRNEGVQLNKDSLGKFILKFSNYLSADRSETFSSYEYATVYIKDCAFLGSAGCYVID